MILNCSIRAPTRRRGLSLIEVVVAGFILAVSAVAIMSAFAASAQVTTEIAKNQQAAMLASGLMEEIKCLRNNFEKGDYYMDDISTNCEGGALYQERISSGCGDDCSPTGGKRKCFDDRTDYADYQDGPTTTVGDFVDYNGVEIPLFDQGAETLIGGGFPVFNAGGPVPQMYRTVEVYENYLNGMITAPDPPALEVHVIVYQGSPASPGEELAHLIQIFRD